MLRVCAGILACCIPLHTAVADTLCDALNEFTEAIIDTDTHQVTLKTDWGAEATVTCARKAAPPEMALCQYLIHNTSREFMTVNIRRVLECLGTTFPEDSAQLYVADLSGTVRSSRPAFTDIAVDIEVSFNTTSSEDLPSLTISVTRQE